MELNLQELLRLLQQSITDEALVGEDKPLLSGDNTKVYKDKLKQKLTTPKELQNLRNQLKQARKNKKEKLEAEDVDAEELGDIQPEEEKAKGLKKIPNLVANKAKQLKKFIVPTLQNLIANLLIDTVKTEVIDQLPTLTPEQIAEAKQKFCPTPEQLDLLVRVRNNMVEYLESSKSKVDLLLTSTDVALTIVNVLTALIQTASATVLATSAATAALGVSGLPAPALSTAAVDVAIGTIETAKFDSKGNSRISPIISAVSQVGAPIAIFSQIITQSLNLLQKLDYLILLCNPEAKLDPIPADLQQIQFLQLQSDLSPVENGLYKGFLLEIETKPFSQTVNQNRAVAKNQSGIVLISTQYSFASNPQILIEELKFIIDRDNLKAY